MKVLVVGDFTAQPCGIRNFADQTYTALHRHPGLEVDKWDGHYPEIYRRREACEAGVYLPQDAADYDVIHVNWHPIAFNTYGPGHFPEGPILSVYLNDIPPWSGCPFHDQAHVRFAAEPSPGCAELPYPIADWIDLPDPDPEFTVGCSSVRGDGVRVVQETCAANDWRFTLPDHSQGWLSFEDEVRRQARNTVNVLWYFEGRGKSGGLSQALSGGRPVICSDSLMFSHFQDYSDGIFRPTEKTPTLETLLQRVHSIWSRGLLAMYRPNMVLRERSWSKATAQMVTAWEEARRG